ncbi:hypothetical protein [Chishuiella sp.]|uniref:hypothetical protein n=1 Tax=Chishuiella sp. TaxID=1969467 RepID=UPI0028AE3862|nr:hypothetical protein [Chishuiella sp.]
MSWIGNSEPKTESIPHFGQTAVSPPFGSSIHSIISIGRNVFSQQKQAHNLSERIFSL